MELRNQFRGIDSACLRRWLGLPSRGLSPKHKVLFFLITWHLACFLDVIFSSQHSASFDIILAIRHLAYKYGLEPVFVDLLWSPGIDSQPGGPVRQPYLSYRPAMLHRQVESNPPNRFLVSLNVYKYGLCYCSQLLQDYRSFSETQW